MPITTGVEPELEPGVSEEIQRYNAEAAFRTACDVVRACFPAMRSLRVELLEDPDVNDRNWVMLGVGVPESYSLDALEKERLRFHEAMVQQVPLELNLLFGLSVRFLPE